MTTPFLIRTRTPTTSTPTPPSPPPLHFFAALSASVLPRLSRRTLQPPPSSSASATTSTAQPHALLQHRETTDALDALQFMASLREPQISVTAGTTPAATTTTTAPLPSIARALAFVPPAMGSSSSSPPPAHLRCHPELQLPPLVSLFAPPPQRHAHAIDGLYPAQAQAQPQARPNHFCGGGGGGGGGPQLRPRAVPSVIHLKDQQQVPPTSGQQPGPRRQRPLDWIDLTGNVEEEEEKCDKKKPQLPPFTSSQRGGTWCIRFGSADDGHKVGPTSSTTATSAETDDGEKRCAHCGTRSTPEWRRGPTGRGTLCNACGLKYTKTLQAQRRKGKTGSALGSVPLASLLNGPEDRKRRTSLSSPMVWQTTVKNFVSTPPSSSSTSTRSPSSPSSSSLLSASFPPAHLFNHACSLSSFSVSPPASSRDAGSPRKRARTQSLPNPPTHQ